MKQDKIKQLFEGRILIIATKHNKEKVIAPALEKFLGVKCKVAENFDTDSLGTFTGEIERTEDPFTTAKNKCLLAMEINNCDLAIASEGSFRPHPTFGFIYVDDEILLFVDKKNNLEIGIRELSIETNFNALEISTEEELIEFANSVKFPSHALILRKSRNDNSDIIKGITDWKLLKNSFNELKCKYGVVYIETDMRAMNNPTRMKVIEGAAERLAIKISTCCPNCNVAGFGITAAKPGLPCSLCGFPTRSTLAYEYKCKACNFIEEKQFPDGKRDEDPTYCDICNP